MNNRIRQWIALLACLGFLAVASGVLEELHCEDHENHESSDCSVCVHLSLIQKHTHVAFSHVCSQTQALALSAEMPQDTPVFAQQFRISIPRAPPT